jgi:hypothetical protein
MKKKSPRSVPASREFTEDDIRDYAFHLYQQSGCVPGHDLDNWLEAKACLEANIPKHHARTRLHRQRHPEEANVVTIVELTAVTPSPFDAFATRPPGAVQVEKVMSLEKLRR